MCDSVRQKLGHTMLYIMHAEINAKLGKFWHIFLMQKLFKRIKMVSIFQRISNRTICMRKIEKCHSCHLHTKSLMPPSNFFMLYACFMQRKTFFVDWKCALICICPPIYLHLIFEISSAKNWVWWTWFFV